MEWQSIVSQAISTSKKQNTVLLVLVEPAANIIFPSNTNGEEEDAKHLYARVATNSLHDRLFLHDDILLLIKQSKTICLKIEACSTDSNFQSFQKFFQLDNNPPNLFLIAPQTGIVLFRKPGYVSPIVFASALCRAYWTITGTTLKLPSSLLPNKDNIKTNIQTKDLNKTLSTTTKSIESIKNKKSLQIPNQTRLRAKLPSGETIEKRFDSNNTFQIARNWLSEQCSQPSSNLQISNVFPRRIFTPNDDLKKLIELDLYPSSSLLVTLIDMKSSTSTPSSILSSAIPRFTTSASSSTNDTNGTSSWRAVRAASSTYNVLSSFVRTFINPIENVNGENNTTTTTNNNNQNNNNTGPSRNTLRMTQNNNNNNNNEDENEDDQQWLSNGNSTQFGWNPRDVDEDTT